MPIELRPSPRQRVVINLAAALLAVLAPFLMIQTANAGTFTKTLVRFDRMAASATSTGTVCLAPTVTTNILSVKVTFPTGYTLAAVSGTSWRVNTTNLAWPSGASALTGVTTADNVTGQAVRFPVTTFTPSAGTLYCFNWTDASATQPGSAGADKTGTVESHSNSTASALIDSGSYATATATNGDQITVTATINQTFNFTLSSSSADALGTLTTANPVTSPTPKTARVDTNAKNGWQMWASSQYAALRSATSGPYLIASNCSASVGSNSTLSAGNEGYNFGVDFTSQTSGSATPTVAAIFQRTATNYKGGGLCTNLQTIATSAGTANNSVFTVYNTASINGATPAANDYTDVVTLVAAGLF